MGKIDWEEERRDISTDVEVDRRYNILSSSSSTLKHVMMKCDFLKLLYIYLKSRGERLILCAHLDACI